MISLDKQNTRIYLRGDTYAAREAIKAAGGHWDPDQRAWWLGAAKAEAAARIAGAAATEAPAPAPTTLPDDTVIHGKASYKGKAGYLLLWEGQTKRGTIAAKLAFRDGSRTFWADAGTYQVDKHYHEREWRGRIEPGMTFGRLKRLAAEYAQARKDGVTPCHKCGGLHRNVDHGCYMCGCTRCDGARPGGLCEDD